MKISYCQLIRNKLLSIETDSSTCCLSVFRSLAEMYLAQISSAEENDSSPQQKIGNSSEYSKNQFSPVLHLYSRAPSVGDRNFRRK